MVWPPLVAQEDHDILIAPLDARCNVYRRRQKGDTRVKRREEWTAVPGMMEPLVGFRVFKAVREPMQLQRAPWCSPQA